MVVLMLWVLYTLHAPTWIMIIYLIWAFGRIGLFLLKLIHRFVDVPNKGE